MRSIHFFSLLLTAVLLTSCSKEALLADSEAGTVLELGFGWMEPAESCFDSDDHSATHCGQAVWLDGTRVQIDFSVPEAEEAHAENQVLQEVMESESVRYVYNPTSRTVTLFVSTGSVTLEWNQSLGCLEGDLLDQDFLSICSHSTSVPSGI